MSRADAASRIVRAAIALGAAQGVGALSLQAIARGAGVSKALLLYHYATKAALLDAVVSALARASEERLRGASAAADAMAAWRTLAREEAREGGAALLAALALEAEVDGAALQAARAAREAAAAQLVVAVLAGVGLAPRVPAPFLGRLLVRQADGLSLAARRDGLAAEALEAELDAFALALLALGR